MYHIHPATCECPSPGVQAACCTSLRHSGEVVSDKHNGNVSTTQRQWQAPGAALPQDLPWFTWQQVVHQLLGTWEVCHHRITSKGTGHLCLSLAGNRCIFSTDFETEYSNFSDIEESTLSINSLKQQLLSAGLHALSLVCQLLHDAVYTFGAQGLEYCALLLSPTLQQFFIRKVLQM